MITSALRTFRASLIISAAPFVTRPQYIFFTRAKLLPNLLISQTNYNSEKMEFNNFLTNLSLIQKLAPIEIPIFVHHSHDEKKHFFDFQTVRENTGNEYWSVLIVEMEEGWAVFDNIGPSDSMSVSCAISSNISLPKPADLKHILNHYFPGRSNLHVFDVIEFSKHDPQGMISAMLFTYCRIFRQPWPKRTILEQESNVTALKLYFRSCELSKKLAKFPPWVLRGPLDDDYIITPTSHEGLISDEELYHRPSWVIETGNEAE